MTDAVRIEGLRDLQRDLKAMQPDVRREVKQALKEGAAVVAKRGAANAPRGTRPIPDSRRPRKRLHETVAPGASQNSAYVRSRALYGPKIERATGFLSRALEQSEDAVVDAVGDAFEAVAARHGWR